MSDFSSIKSDASSRMDKTIETLKTEFSGLRAGRAHASLLDGIMVEAYGSMTPLAQVGTISVLDARTLSVSVWDRSMAKAVEKAKSEFLKGATPATGKDTDTVSQYDEAKKAGNVGGMISAKLNAYRNRDEE